MFKYIVLAFACIACVAARPGLISAPGPILSAPLSGIPLGASSISYGTALAAPSISLAQPLQLAAPVAKIGLAAPAIAPISLRTIAAPALAPAPLSLGLGLGHPW